MNVKNRINQLKAGAVLATVSVTSLSTYLVPSNGSGFGDSIKGLLLY